MDLLVNDGEALLGHGDGTFTTQNTGAAAVAAVDFNGDGASDLLENFGPYVLFAAPQSAAASTTITLPPATGTDQVFASYAGDSNNTGSTSGAQPLLAGQATPTVSLTASETSVAFGSSITLTVQVIGSGAEPTGRVTFFDGSAQLGSGSVDGTGKAAYTTTSLTVGTHAITASYGGDANYLVAHSASVSVEITSVPAAITVAAPPLVSAGGTATATLTISAGSSYSGTLNLICVLTASPSGAQSLPTCGLKPNSVTLAAGGSATATLSVATTGATTAFSKPPARNTVWRMGAGGMVLCGVFFWGFPARRRIWMRGLTLISLAIGLGAIGCGGSHSSAPASPSTPATTAGKYTFSVTGTDSANPSTSFSATVVVTVN